MKPKRKQPVRAVVFDMGNVLLHFDAIKSCKRFARGCHVPLAKLWKHFFTDSVEKAYTRGEISSYDFYRHAKKALAMPVDYKTFCRYWNDIFWENKGIVKVLRQLKKKYPLYLISNTNDLHFRHIAKKYPTLRHFKMVFPSHKMGARKPDSKIYKMALKKMKLRPEETVFVDDVPKFVRGARRVGMQAVRFRSNTQLVHDLRKLNVEV